MLDSTTKAMESVMESAKEMQVVVWRLLQQWEAARALVRSRINELIDRRNDSVRNLASEFFELEEPNWEDMRTYPLKYAVAAGMGHPQSDGLARIFAEKVSAIEAKIAAIEKLRAAY